MPTVNDLVALGNHSYTPNLRNGDAGPAGAVVIDRAVIPASGFQATAYRLPDGDVVVALAVVIVVVVKEVWWRQRRADITSH
jgi:hypothetical protein